VKKKTLMSTKYVYKFTLQGSSEMFLILRRDLENIFVNMQRYKQKIRLFS